MKMKNITALILSFVTLQVYSQNSSKPYFQQHVAYTIQVKLNDNEHMLSGTESFVYTNNSDVELKEIYMHIWPNAYKNSKTALAKQLARMKDFVLFTSLEEDKGFIDSLNFTVNGQKADWALDPVNIDICKINLATPLQPGQSCTIATPFRVKLPSGSISRLGHIGQSYQITQWYPKPAVFDRDGWHPMPYLTQGEFYSEYGSYDVSITLPKNYILGATGDCQTPSEVEFMNLQATLSESKMLEGASNEFPESSKEYKTVRYTQSNVHDFGWFADKRWIVKKGEVITPAEGNKVATWAL
ncbi:MAG: M1 family peptidase, partial [Bacteroidota bacterium]